jgi:hypothetical protein|tara:strand:- start:2863 stop:3045 length:183 start_codon:yes stop_codon:yes gene_type:complete
METKKTLKSDEVIELITYKIQLKKSLRDLKKSGNLKQADMIQLKLEQVEEKLHSSPLSKT